MAAIPYQAQEQVTILRPPPSKLRPPAMGAPFLPRERLIARMRDAHDARLILVHAPAGFGTSSLLRHAYDLARTDGYATAWMTIDAGDNDLDRFMTCLGQAFARTSGAASLPSLVGDATFELAEALAAVSGPFILILDELEHLHNPAALAIVQQLIEMLGPRQRLLIGSREQPVLALGQLRARRQLLEIDASQLRFSLEESTRFLCEKRNLRLDAEDIARLHHITDGWAAALWLSSLALENNDDPKRFIRNFSGSNSVVASYLAEAVLSRRPKHLQDFILQTSVLQKFCADSCNAITGRSDSHELLSEIERSNMFMTALDEQRHWFSYHPLFAGFLRAQLERQYPGQAERLHRRAALWHARQERPTPAIDHAIASGDKALVLQLLGEHAEPLFLQGRVRLLARWFDTLDLASLAAQPKLLSVYTWSLIHINRSGEALTLLESFNDGSVTRPMSHSTYLVLKTFSLVMLDRIEQTAPMWEDPHILGTAAREPLLRSMLMIGCAYYFATVGRYHDARRLLDQATHEHDMVGPLFSVAVAGYIHALLDLLQGQLRSAIARLRTLISDSAPVRVRSTGPRLRALIGAESELPNPRYGADTGFASIYLAEALYEADALDEAGRLLSLYLPLVKDAGIPDQLASSHLVQSRILRASGRANEALQVLLELEQLGMQRRLVRIVDIARMERARALLLDGDIEGARTMLALVSPTPAWQRRDLQMVSNDMETRFLGTMRLQVHSGQAAATLSPLKEHLQDAYARGRMRYALRVKVLYALALSQAGQRNPALRAIRETLQDALSEGFVRPFKDEGPMVIALVRDMLEGMKDLSSVENDAVRLFAESLSENTGVGARSNEASLPSHVVTTSSANECELTARELDVLVLLAQGNGNQVIAEKLFVSVTTVKTHLRNINIKLASRNRTEAIANARALGIIK